MATVEFYTNITTTASGVSCVVDNTWNYTIPTNNFVITSGSPSGVIKITYNNPKLQYSLFESKRQKLSLELDDLKMPTYIRKPEPPPLLELSLFRGVNLPDKEMIIE